MANSANHEIVDGVLTHTINLTRIAAGERAAALKALEDLEGHVLAKIQAGGNSKITQSRLVALLKQTQDTIAGAYATIAANHGKALSKVAQLEATKITNIVNGALNVSVATVGISPEQLSTIASKVMINGKFPAEHWKDQEAQLAGKFAVQMRQGMFLGEDTEALIRRVRGTKAKGYQDGLFVVSKAQAAALVRTSVLTTANEARIKTMEGNTEVVKGIQWVATLDARTTPICRALDGLQWSLPDYKPVGHDKVFPGPIAHWQCRSTQVPVTRSWAELGGPNAKKIDGDAVREYMRKKLEKQGFTPEEIEKRLSKTRASMDGQAAGPITFGEWLKNKSPAFQDDLLGKGRAELWRGGKVSISEMTDQDNRPLTLAELHAMVAANSDAKPDVDGEGGLTLAHRKLLQDSMEHGIKTGGIKTHFVDADTGENFAIDGTAPNETEIEKIFKIPKMIVLQNSPTAGATWDSQQLQLFGQMGNFVGAKIVGPSGNVISATVKDKQTFYQRDALDIINGVADLANSKTITQAQYKFRSAAKANGKLSVTISESGVVKPSAGTFNETFAAAEKPAPFYDPEQAKKTAAAEAEIAQKAAQAAEVLQKAKDAARAELEAEKAARIAAQKAELDAKAAAESNAKKLAAELADAEEKAKQAKKAEEQKAADELAATRAAAQKAADDATKARKWAIESNAIKDAADLAAKKAAAELEAANAAAQMEIADILANPAGKKLLHKEIVKIMKDFPKLPPNEALTTAKANAVFAQSKASKAGALSGMKSKLLAGESPTAAQVKVFDALEQNEKDTFLAAVNSAKAAKAAKEAAEAAAATATQAAAANATAAQADAAAAANPVRPIQPTIGKPADFPPDPENLKVIKTLGGSTGAQLVEDENGNRYVRKRGNNPGHIREEIAADNIYRALGFDVPEATLYEGINGPVKLARYVEGQNLGDYLRTATPAQASAVKAKIADGFAADTLLGNWDVIGMGRDNVLIDKTGKPWRIDNGGSMRYRAQGALKSKEWNPYNAEIWTMRGIYSTPRLADLSKAISASTQADYREFFGHLSIYDIARQIERLDSAALAYAPAEVVATITERLEQMKIVARRALDFEHSKWKADFTDTMTRNAMELREDGVIKRMAKRFTGTNPILKDENGNEFDDLRSKGMSGAAAQKAKAAAEPDPFKGTFLAAIISINAANKNGAKQFANAAKIADVKALKPTLENLAKSKLPQDQELAALYKSWVALIEKSEAEFKVGKPQASDVLPKFDATIGTQIVAKHTAPAVVAPKKPGGSVTQDVAHYIETLGGNPDAVKIWLGGQAGSSWSKGAKAMKWYVQAQKTGGQFFDGAGGLADLKAEFDSLAASVGGPKAAESALAAWIAYTQEILENTELPNTDRKLRVVRLLRTEDPSVLVKSAKIGQYGGTHTLIRGSNESHSIMKTTFVAGGEITVQAVPFSDITGLYLTDRPGAKGTPGTGEAAFLGDSENEFTANTSGMPFLYFGSRSSAAAASGDKGNDASKWGVPLTHIRKP